MSVGTVSEHLENPPYTLMSRLRAITSQLGLIVSLRLRSQSHVAGVGSECAITMNKAFHASTQQAPRKAKKRTTQVYEIKEPPKGTHASKHSQPRARRPRGPIRKKPVPATGDTTVTSHMLTTPPTDPRRARLTQTNHLGGAAMDVDGASTTLKDENVLASRIQWPCPPTHPRGLRYHCTSVSDLIKILPLRIRAAHPDKRLTQATEEVTHADREATKEE
ncbi:hypothetical protein HD554DRAFT_2042103 [Boletus coccyginus]|nr:hypothetical protein HD554DRAFT_2042103 [Boletus coccyginus]